MMEKREKPKWDELIEVTSVLPRRRRSPLGYAVVIKTPRRRHHGVVTEPRQWPKYEEPRNSKGSIEGPHKCPVCGTKTVQLKVLKSKIWKDDEGRRVKVRLVSVRCTKCEDGVMEVLLPSEDLLDLYHRWYDDAIQKERWKVGMQYVLTKGR